MTSAIRVFILPPSFLADYFAHHVWGGVARLSNATLGEGHVRENIGRGIGFPDQSAPGRYKIVTDWQSCWTLEP